MNLDKHTYIYAYWVEAKYVINMLSYLHVSCVTRINLDKHMYIYAYWVEGKMWFYIYLCIMLWVMGARRVSKGRVKGGNVVCYLIFN